MISHIFIVVIICSAYAVTAMVPADLETIRDNVKSGILNGSIPYIPDLFASDPRESFLKNVYENVITDKPIYVIFSRVNDVRIGNTIGQLIHHLACAHVAGLHAIVINHDWTHAYHDEVPVGQIFVDALCSVYVHPSPSTRAAAWEVVSRNCSSSTAPWYWEDHTAPWTIFVPQLRDVLQGAFEKEIFDSYIRSDSKYQRFKGRVPSHDDGTPHSQTLINLAARSIPPAPPIISVFPNDDQISLIPHVLVQVRCSDNFADSMGMLPFHAIFDRMHHYHHHVITNTNESLPQLRVYITTEAEVMLDNAPLRNICPPIVSLLQQEIAKRFPGWIVSVQRGRVFHTWYMMSQADVVICAASTFCLWPSLSNRLGTVYLPMTPLFGRNRRLDFGPTVTNVHFITDYQLYGIVAGKDSMGKVKSHLLAPRHSDKSGGQHGSPTTKKKKVHMSGPLGKILSG